jgi:hypothetical protein
LTSPLTPAVRDALGRAPHLAVALLTARGPHCTPELFVVSAGRLWCLTAANTLKARLLEGGGEVAFVASAGGQSVVGLGAALVIDAARPLQNLRQPRAAAASPLAVGRFGSRNAFELAGAALDLLTGKLGRPLPPRRVAICIEPTSTAVVTGGVLAESTGWPGGNLHRTPVPTSARTEVETGDLIEDLPADLRALAAAGPAVIATTDASGGVVALPSVWDGSSTATTPSAVFDLVGASLRSPLAVMRDEWTGYGPSGKQGLMLRGQGVSRRKAAETTIQVAVAGVTYWDGVRTGSAWTR